MKLILSLLIRVVWGVSLTSVAVAHQIGVAIGPFEQAARYNPDVHQALLARPSSWCGARRPADPLLAEAIRIATGNSNDALAERRLRGIPRMRRGEIALIREEKMCEQAAKAFDRAVHAGQLLEEHKRLQPALVVKLGPVFLVEEARPRGEIWEVKFFDLNWHLLGFGYGAGA